MFGTKKKPIHMSGTPEVQQLVGVQADQASSSADQSYQNADYNQIPYEVYETIHGPTARRRRWAVRLVAALLTVTLLVIGGTALKSKLDSTNNQQTVQPNVAGKQEQPASNNKGNDQTSQQSSAASQQAPQANAPLQKSNSNPASTPQSGTTNTGTVNQPE